ncbi:unnamed protein product [Effrenium voratum]|nr:unnamed protein product [Effrenium voratum]
MKLLVLAQCLLAVGVHAHEGAPRRRSMLQLFSTQMRSRALSGRRLRLKRAHSWTDKCRHLPLLQRPGCEREVDRQLLKEASWVQTNPDQHAAAFSISLDHD